MRLVFWAVVLVAVLAGGLLGYVFPEQSSAAQIWQFWVKVPARTTDGDTARLNCGWHTDCSKTDAQEGRYGPALDWSNHGAPGSSSQTGVWLRGAGFHDVPYAVIGSEVVPRFAPGENNGCYYNVIVDWYNYFDGSWQVSQVHTHARDPRSPTVVYYGNPAFGMRYRVATMATTSDPYGCPWTGTHVHSRDCLCSPVPVYANTAGFEWHSGGPWYHNNLEWTHYFEWWW